MLLRHNVCENHVRCFPGVRQVDSIFRAMPTKKIAIGNSGQRAPYGPPEVSEGNGDFLF
jgi:hypothetical protein